MNCSRCQESVSYPSTQHAINFANEDYSVCSSCIEDLREFMNSADKKIPVSTDIG
jgi:hypothetical protein